MANMLLQTIGKAFAASILAMSRQGLFFIPILFILSNTLGLQGLQLAQPLSDLCSLVITIPMIYVVMKEMSNL